MRPHHRWGRSVRTGTSRFCCRACEGCYRTWSTELSGAEWRARADWPCGVTGVGGRPACRPGIGGADDRRWRGRRGGGRGWLHLTANAHWGCRRGRGGVAAGCGGPTAAPMPTSGTAARNPGRPLVPRRWVGDAELRVRDAADPGRDAAQACAIPRVAGPFGRAPGWVGPDGATITTSAAAAPSKPHA